MSRTVVGSSFTAAASCERGVDEREQLAGVLHSLLKDLQPARPADNTQVASVNVDAA
jgi:hypothetical protein